MAVEFLHAEAQARDILDQPAGFDLDRMGLIAQNLPCVSRLHLRRFFWLRFSQKRRDAVNKVRGFQDRFVGFLQAHAYLGTDAVISDSFQIVGLSKKGRKRPINTGMVPGEPRKFAADTAMGFGDLACLLKNERLRSMIGCQIGGAACRFGRNVSTTMRQPV